MSYINIAKDDQKPLFVDASDITGVHFHTGEKGKQELTLYNGTGQMMWIGTEGWNVDAKDAVEKLRAAGVPLLALPVRWPDRDDKFKEYEHYINPEAVTFMTVSEPGKDGLYGTIVGVRGIGREESYGTTQEELDALVNTVSAVKNLQHYAPDIAHSRWSRASALYIDPASVTQVRDDGYQVNVYFTASGSLDVQVTRSDVNKVANEIYQGGKDTRDLNEIFAEAHDRVKKADIAARADFANKVASVNTSMIRLETEDRTCYINRALISYISFHDDERSGNKSMHLHSQKTQSNPYPDDIGFYFKTDEDRRAAFESLQKQLDTPAPAAPAQKKPGGLNF